MKYSETICCCIPVRLGVFIISIIIALLYLTLIIIAFIKKQDLENWSTMREEVNTPLTVEAFNGVFYTFSTTFIVYIAVSVFGIASIILQQRRMVRIYHIINWFFVLLLFTASVAFWVYFNVKQDVYVNDCQTQKNLQNNAKISIYYSQIPVSGKQLIAPGSDKSECMNFIKKVIIASGACIFIFNLLQLYWARSIGKYANTLKRHYQHQRLDIKDEVSVESE